MKCLMKFFSPENVQQFKHETSECLREISVTPSKVHSPKTVALKTYIYKVIIYFQKTWILINIYINIMIFLKYLSLGELTFSWGTEIRFDRKTQFVLRR